MRKGVTQLVADCPAVLGDQLLNLSKLGGDFVIPSLKELNQPWKTGSVVTQIVEIKGKCFVMTCHPSKKWKESLLSFDKVEEEGCMMIENIIALNITKLYSPSWC